MKKEATLGILIAAAWLAVSFFIFSYIHRYNYGYGRERATLLLLLCAVFLIAPMLWRRFRLEQPSGPVWTGLVLMVAVVALGINIRESVVSIGQVLKTNQIPSDQSYAAIHSINLLKEKVNPYGQTVLVPSHDLGPLLDKGKAHGHCFDEPLSRITSHEMLVTRIKNTPECESLRVEIRSMGFKYGPVLLLAYWPFVSLFGHAGVLILHVLCFLALVGFLCWYGYSSRMTAASIGFLVIVSILPADFRLCVLNQGHTDILPTLLAFTGLLFWIRGRPSAMGAVLVGLSLAAKTMPGLLYAPLLLRSRKEALTLIGVVAFIALPFLVLDPRGFWYNLSYPFFLRYEDSTSLAYYLSETLQHGVLAGSLALIAFFFIRLVRQGWLFSGALNFLVVAHIGAFVTASVFHSNYMVVLFPLLAVILSRTVSECAA